MSDREGSGSASPTAPGDRQGQVPPGVPWPPPKTSGLAIASLVCGALGFFSCGIGGLVGLLLGIIGLSSIRKSQGKVGGSGLAVGGIVVSICSFLTLVLAVGILMPAFARAHSEARKAGCRGNLHNIGLGMAMYTTDYPQLPPDLDGLYPSYIDQLSAFDCAGRRHAIVSFPGIEASGSYEYVGPLSAVPGYVIIVLDKAGNHRDGRNALFKDGHVEFISNAQLPARLQASLDLVKEAGWDQYSEERKAEIEAFYTP